MSKWIFITGNVPSLKNGKEIIQLPIKGAKPCCKCGHKKGRPMLTASKLHKRYAKTTNHLWQQYRKTFKEIAATRTGRLHVLLYFVRDSRRKFDFTNATDTVQDLMVKHEGMEDDNTTVMVPVFAGVEVDKTKAGVYIAVASDDDVMLREWQIPKMENKLL